MTYFWTKSMNNCNWSLGSAKTLRFILPINTSNNIIIKNGIKEIDIFMIIFTQLISLKIKPKMLTAEFGPLTLLKSEWDQEESTIFTISWQAITLSLHMEWTYQKGKVSTPILITWLSVCQGNFKMECSISKTVHPLRPLKWLMTLRTLSVSFKEEADGEDLTNKSESGLFLQDWCYFCHLDILKLLLITEIWWVPEPRFMQSEIN